MCVEDKLLLTCSIWSSEGNAIEDDHHLTEPIDPCVPGTELEKTGFNQESSTCKLE